VSEEGSWFHIICLITTTIRYGSFVSADHRRKADGTIMRHSGGTGLREVWNTPDAMIIGHDGKSPRKIVRKVNALVIAIAIPSLQGGPNPRD
jgi:hypothetical protein